MTTHLVLEELKPHSTLGKWLSDAAFRLEPPA
nr:MAG TPA: hypothetical protein [Caudoviricetes sp.]